MKFKFLAIAVLASVVSSLLKGEEPIKKIDNPARLRVLHFLSERVINPQGLDTTPSGFEAYFVKNGKPLAIQILYDAPSSELRNLEPGPFSIEVKGSDGSVISGFSDTLKPDSVNLFMIYGPQKTVTNHRKIEFNVTGGDKLVRILNLSSVEVILRMAGRNVKIAANASTDFSTSEKELEYQIAAFDDNRWRVRQKGFIWRSGEGPCLAVIYPNGLRNWTMSIAYDSAEKSDSDNATVDKQDLNLNRSGIVP